VSPPGLSQSVLLAIGEEMGLRSPAYIFWAVRDELERAASAKYDRTARADSDAPRKRHLTFSSSTGDD
jgi:hypothetical protein